MIKQLAKSAGWIILSVICIFGIVLLVQWLTFEVANLLLIENHILLLVLACLLAIIFPKRFGFIGACVFVALLLFLTFLDHNLSFALYNLCALLLLGTAIGTFLKEKRWWFGSIGVVLSLVVLWNAERVYGTMEVVNMAPKHQTDATRFNELSNTFVAVDGNNLQLYQDTVYLVNFTFFVS